MEHESASQPEKLVSAARGCPALTDAEKLAEWVGAGRPLTTRGVPKPAAVVEVCDLLGIELRTRKPRSALDIDRLMMVWAVALSAGFVEVDRSRATAGAALPTWTGGTAEAVLEVWTQCVLGCFGLSGESGEPDPEILGGLAALYESDGAVSLDDLGEHISDVLDGGTTGCSCPSCVSSMMTLQDLSDLPDEPDSVLRIDEVKLVEALGEFGIVSLSDGEAELTPLGRWFTDVLFRQGAPVADADAITLVDAVAGLPDRVALVMARPWLSARSPVTAARELLTTGESGSGKQRLTAITLARACGPDAAPAWREQAAQGGSGAYARVWLAEQDGTEPTEADMAWITMDSLDSLLDGLPPDLPPRLVAALLRDQVGDALSEILPVLADSDHPAAYRLITLLTGRPVAIPLPHPATVMPPGTRYRIKVTLRGAAKPPVWRRLEVPADLDLGQLHEVVQAAMGWEDYHLHVFSQGGADYGLPDPDLGHADERAVRLCQLLTDVGDRLDYTYDFGDGWEHEITLEKVLPVDDSGTGAICTAGKGACPPEDCGGVWGYRELKATLADPGAESHESLLDWLGLASPEDFDPHAFSTEDANRQLGPSTRRRLRSVR